jgi:hypothetical protein
MPNCDPLLAIPVTVDFETEGGALRETFGTELRVTSLDLANFSATLPAESLSGELELERAPRDVTLQSITIDGFVSPFGTAGSVGVTLTSGETGSDSELAVDSLAASATAAYWPSATCDPQAAAYGVAGTVVDSDEAVGGQRFVDLVEALEAFSPLPLSWSDGRKSAFRFELETGPDACVVDQGGSLRLRGSVEVTFSTEDGAISGTLPGQLSDDGGAEDGPWVSLSSNAFLPPSEFLKAVTLEGIDVAGYEQVSFNLFLGGSESLTGGLSISGTESCGETPEAPELVSACASPLVDAGLGEFTPIDGPVVE